MRKSTWIASFSLAMLAAIGLLSFQFTTPVSSAQKAETKPVVDDRDELANKLMERVTLKEPIKDQPLTNVVELLTEKYGLTILVDRKSLAGDSGDDAVRKQSISIPAMKNVRLSTVLKAVADQVDGVYLVYPDHFEIVSTAKAATIAKPTLKNLGNDIEDQPPPLANFETLIKWSLNLVTISFSETPLQEALKEIENRTNTTIVLANQAGENGRAFVTARFANVPVECAVATLAEMAGLKMARKGNVLLVTTPDRADEFDPPPPPPTNQVIEELKKRVAELEKENMDLKLKK